MDFKQLLDISNATVVGMVESMRAMGLDIGLIWSRMAKSFENEAKGMLEHAGVKISGSDVPSIVNNFAEGVKSIGVCQRANVLEATDDKIVIDLGECAFAPATHVLRAGDPKFIPPCPMLAILQSAIGSALKKNFRITQCDYKPDENTSIFTMTTA